MNNSPKRLLVAGMLSLILALTFAIYWPGLSGDFLLDDLPNLSKLQKISAPLSWEQIGIFTTSNNAGPLGRPISMLSFALQYASWPADPAAFKWVNLLIHLANGCLVFALLLVIGKAAQWRTHVQILAGSVAAIWLLHPIQVSSTLYIIQRMTLLSASFTLIGLLAFVLGRQLVARGENTRGYVLAGAGIALGTALAVASKENGVLLPVFAFVIEITLFSHHPLGAGWKKWKAAFFYLPAFCATLFLMLHFGKYVNASSRDFTLLERVLTEPRVLIDYLRKIFLLPPYDFGVYFDDYRLSKGILSPTSTLLAIIGWLLLLTSALWSRRRWPLYSFAVLWFLAGHLLESTIIPLELYFEHRNYLPSLGIIVCVSYYASELLQKRQTRITYGLLAGLLCFVMLALTWQQTRLWGSPLIQAAIWAKEKPTSQRALERAGTEFTRVGRPEEANRYFTALGQQFPNKADGPMFHLYLRCLNPNFPSGDTNELTQRLANGQNSRGVMSVLSGIVQLKEAHHCDSITPPQLQALFDILLKNANFKESQSILQVLRARAYVTTREYPLALSTMDEAYNITPNKEVAFQQLRWAAEAGLTNKIEGYIEKTRRSSTGHRQHDQLIDQQLLQFERYIEVNR